MLKKHAVFSKPYIGIFSIATEELTVVPQVDKEVFSEAMDTSVVRTTVGGTRVNGSLMCGNSNGLLVSDIAEEREIEPLLDHTDVTTAPDHLNALGNNVLMNDYGALLHPDLNEQTEDAVHSLFDVEVEKGTVAGMSTVGSIAVVTNKGALCHPHTDEEEMEMMEELFDVPVEKTTANHGSAWIGTCLIANTAGAVIGNETTPIEMGRIEEGLGYLD